MTRSVAGACFAVALSAAAPGSLQGQWGFWPADSLLAAGKLPAAESAYYGAVRERPRDPQARAALGRFIAARGGARAGAVLLDEARFFGGDSAALARALVPLYERLGDYAALDSLRPRVLSTAERARAHWLASHPPQTRLHDKVVLFTFRPIADGRGLGTVLVKLGSGEIPTVIDPRVTGIVLPSAMRRDLRVFGRRGQDEVAVAESLRIGGVVFSNVPALIGGSDEPARIGFDVLAPFTPTFDPRSGLVTLRSSPDGPLRLRGTRVPALYDENGLRLLLGGRWYPSSASTAAMFLATRAWTWDSRKGDVVLSYAPAARP